MCLLGEMKYIALTIETNHNITKSMGDEILLNNQRTSKIVSSG